MRVTRLQLALVVAAEVALASYAALIAFVMCSWFVDDSRAFRMTDRDWLVEGGSRFAVACLSALVVGFVIEVTNRLLLRKADASPWLRVVRPLGTGAAILVTLAAAVGAVLFVVRRPYM